MFISKTKQRGFTLIELLVVISIISLLSSIVLVTLSNVKVKARDAKRKSDINQIMMAIDLYLNDHGTYPISGGAITPSSVWTNSSDSSWSDLATQLRPYIPSLPKDPLQSIDPNIWAGGGYAYSYFFQPVICSNTSYMFVYHLETVKGPDMGFNIGPACGGLWKYGQLIEDPTNTNTSIKTTGNSY